MSSPQGDRFNRIPTRSAYPVYPEIVSPSPARRGAFEGYPSTPTLSQSSPSHQYSSDDQYSAQQPGPSSPRRRPHAPVSQSAVSRHHANSPDAAPLRLAPLPSVSRLAEGHRPAVSQPAVFQPDVPPMSPVAARSPTSDQRPVLPINQPAAVPYPPYPPSSPAPAQEEDLLRHHRMQAGDLSRGHASYLDLHHHRPPQGPNGELPRIRSGAASRGGGERLDGLRVKVPFATQCSACNEYIERNAELYGRSMMLFNDEAYLRDCRVLRCFLHCPRCVSPPPPPPPSSQCISIFPRKPGT